MKTKYMSIAALAALGLAVAIVQPCAAKPAPEVYPAAQPPATQAPTQYVWDGKEYVGQENGKYYYLDSQDTWVRMDQTREQRFDDWKKNNPNWKSKEIRNTRYQGHDLGQSHAAPNPPPHENPKSPD